MIYENLRRYTTFFEDFDDEDIENTVFPDTINSGLLPILDDMCKNIHEQKFITYTNTEIDILQILELADFLLLDKQIYKEILLLYLDTHICLNDTIYDLFNLDHLEHIKEYYKEETKDFVRKSPDIYNEIHKEVLRLAVKNAHKYNNDSLSKIILDTYNIRFTEGMKRSIADEMEEQAHRLKKMFKTGRNRQHFYVSERYNVEIPVSKPFSYTLRTPRKYSAYDFKLDLVGVSKSRTVEELDAFLQDHKKYKIINYITKTLLLDLVTLDKIDTIIYFINNFGDTVTQLLRTHPVLYPDYRMDLLGNYDAMKRLNQVVIFDDQNMFIAMMTNIEKHKKFLMLKLEKMNKPYLLTIQ